VKRPYLAYNRRFVRFLEDFREPRPAIPGEEYGTRSVVSILWLRLKNVVGPEYAPLNTGVSITRGNSGNGALPTRESEGGEDEDDTG
jgi:hypothetical protein